ncbi:MAG: hypothetical protein R3C49_04420 [Planctomycetaceae bacterium]
MATLLLHFVTQQRDCFAHVAASLATDACPVSRRHLGSSQLQAFAVQVLEFGDVLFELVTFEGGQFRVVFEDLLQNGFEVRKAEGWMAEFPR